MMGRRLSLDDQDLFSFSLCPFHGNGIQNVKIYVHYNANSFSKKINK